MTHSIKQFAGPMVQRLTKRSRSGQSLVIIAFAFIALIAFVGIATDVALLFVRFSTLRRAVDAAAIAAAGQVRESADYITLNAVAKQFIQVHGLDANSVKVETCETEMYDYITKHPGANRQTALSALITANSELCKTNPTKLVKVSAQILSPTTFLSILGFRTVTLVSSSISQTASLDVALLLDTSLSEANDTRAAEDAITTQKTYYNSVYKTSETNNADALRSFPPMTLGQPTNAAQAIAGGIWGVGLQPFPKALLDAVYPPGYVPPVVTGPTAYQNPNAASPNAFDTALTGTTTSIRYECWYTPRIDGGTPNNEKANYNWAGCCNDPTVQADSYDAGGNPVASFDYTKGTGYNTLDPDWYVTDDPTFKESVIMTTGNKLGAGVNTAAKVMYGGYSGFNANGTLNTTGAFKNMTGDHNYSDLICKPFKDVRDSARRFIKRLDFVRGDRIVLVTFDSEARAIKPYPTSAAGQPALGETLPIISDKDTAVRALNMQVGVEIAPSNNRDECHSFGNSVTYKDWMDQAVTDQRYYPDVNSTLGGNVTNSYWTRVQCVDTNTGGGIVLGMNALVDPNWVRREAVWVMVVLSDGFPNRTPQMLDSGINGENRDWLVTLGHPNGAAPITGTLLDPYCKKPADHSNPPPPYGTIPEYCANYVDVNGGNITAAWGWKYNDPLYHPNVTAGETARPYGAVATDSNNLDGGAPQPRMSFGFCPLWTLTQGVGAAAQPANTTKQPPPPWWNTATNGVWVDSTGSETTPCANNDPDSRHFCQDSNGAINSLRSTNPATPATSIYSCDERYDAGDYARDRVDFAALAQYTATQKGNFISMYSIFFNPSKSTLNKNILGIKFMRYIADAGDNGKIDNPIQRWYREARDGIAPGLKPTKQNPAGTNPYGPLQPAPSGGYAEAIARGNPDLGTVGASWTEPQVPAAGSNAFVPAKTFSRNTTGTPQDLGTQDWLPNYSATNPIWTQNYGYDTTADPCAYFDYFNAGCDVNGNNCTGVDQRIAPGGPGTNYFKIATTNCGQFFYAEDANGVSQAFVEIASRLFTRLSR